jgi:hypothetical protein
MKSELFFILFAVLFLMAPYFPTSLLLLLDNVIIRVAIVFFLLFIVSKGPTAALFAFLAVAVYYLERNRRKVGHAITKWDQIYSRPATVKESSISAFDVPAFDVPVEKEYEYISKQGCDSSFEPVAPSINQKSVLNTIYSSGSASSVSNLYEKLGVGHIGL